MLTPQEKLARFDQMNSALDDEPEENAPVGAVIRECDRHWIAIELLDEQGRPAAGAEYELTLPTGEVRRGNLNSQGYALERGIELPGKCQIVFPGIQDVRDIS